MGDEIQSVNEVAGQDTCTHTHRAAATAVLPIAQTSEPFFKGELIQLHKRLKTFLLTFFAKYLLNHSNFLLNKCINSVDFVRSATCSFKSVAKLVLTSIIPEQADL